MGRWAPRIVILAVRKNYRLPQIPPRSRPTLSSQIMPDFVSTFPPQYRNVPQGSPRARQVDPAHANMTSRMYELVIPYFFFSYRQLHTWTLKNMLLVIDPHLDRYWAKEARPVQNSTKGTSILRPCDAMLCLGNLCSSAAKPKKGR